MSGKCSNVTIIINGACYTIYTKSTSTQASYTISTGTAIRKINRQRKWQLDTISRLG